MLTEAESSLQDGITMALRLSLFEDRLRSSHYGSAGLLFSSSASPPSLPESTSVDLPSGFAARTELWAARWTRGLPEGARKRLWE